MVVCPVLPSTFLLKLREKCNHPYSYDICLHRMLTGCFCCRLGFASASDVIEVKGRVACEISRYSLILLSLVIPFSSLSLSHLHSGDELLLTELMFNGAFNDLSVEQCVALLSCFVFQEKVCSCRQTYILSVCMCVSWVRISPRAALYFSLEKKSCPGCS